MEDILGLMASNQRHCDDCFAAVEQAVAKNDWKGASAAFSRFQEAMCKHLDAEEAILFPAFENQTGMRMGPTQVMRSEHAQMRELLVACETALGQQDAEEYSGCAETLLILAQQHNMKEENILYPMCDQHLAASVDALAGQLKRAMV